MRTPYLLSILALSTVEVYARTGYATYDCNDVPDICANHCWAVNCMGHRRFVSGGSGVDGNANRGAWGYHQKASYQAWAFGANISPDEYPFASSGDGGLTAGFGGLPVSLRMVPLTQQTTQARYVRSVTRYGEGDTFSIRLTNTASAPTDWCRATTTCANDGHQFEPTARAVFRLSVVRTQPAQRRNLEGNAPAGSSQSGNSDTDSSGNGGGGSSPPAAPVGAPLSDSRDSSPLSPVPGDQFGPPTQGTDGKWYVKDSTGNCYEWNNDDNTLARRSLVLKRERPTRAGAKASTAAARSGVNKRRGSVGKKLKYCPLFANGGKKNTPARTGTAAAANGVGGKKAVASNQNTLARRPSQVGSRVGSTGTSVGTNGRAPAVVKSATGSTSGRNVNTLARGSLPKANTAATNNKKQTVRN